MLLATLLCCTPVFAAETVAVAPEDLSGIETLDEVVVTGKLDSLSAARQAVIAAEDRFYARYNELNTDDRMDILCRFEAPTGSRIPRRVCQPKLVEEAARDEAQRFLNTANGSYAPLTMDSMKAELKARTLKLLAKDPELKRALLERARLEQYFNDLHQKKFKTRWIVWD
jgi:hypothetical protein